MEGQDESLGKYDPRAINRGESPMKQQGSCTGSQRMSIADEHGKAAEHHQSEANKKYRAAAFLKNHPEFDEFIRIIREGVIGI